MNAFLTAQHILTIGHRGARAHAPENTLVGFHTALELGADGIELDVRLAADGVPVVIHDARVDRTTNGQGRVSEMTAAQLATLDAGVHEGRTARIPALDDVFNAFGADTLYNVELKGITAGIELPRAVIACVKTHGLAGRVLISSFNVALLWHCQSLAPDIPTGYLFGEGVPRLPFVRGEAWHPHHASVDAALVAQAPRVHAWTVNDRAAIIQMKTLGVHAIITDYPDRVRDVLHA